MEGTEHRALAYAWLGDEGLKGGVVKHGDTSHCTNYTEAFRAWKKSTGVVERGNAPIAQHLLAIVSEGAIEGDPRDPTNPRVRQLVGDAIGWANRTFAEEGGEPACFAARYDVDEAGCGVVDLLVAPHHHYRSGRGKKKDRIAVSAAHDRLRKRWRRKHSHSALQDSWHDYAMRAGWDVERGVAKSSSAREHLSPEDYKALPPMAQQHIADLESQLATERARNARWR